MTTTTLDLMEGFLGINLACGGKLCREDGWINADHSSNEKDVIKIDLLRPLPYKNDTFDVIYHAQFIEHLTPDNALSFTKECYRILKPNGVLRIVTPDLQNQATEYLRNLQAVLACPQNEDAKLRYDWIRLEMLDQLTRHAPGGDMVCFLNTSGRKIRDYLCSRMGRSGENLIQENAAIKKKISMKRIMSFIKKKFFSQMNMLFSESFRVGKFRLSGEAHLCMYDEYLLTTLLIQSGFQDIVKVSAQESRILDWELTQLDCDAYGNLDGQESLFMEAVKIITTQKE